MEIIGSIFVVTYYGRNFHGLILPASFTSEDVMIAWVSAKSSSNIDGDCRPTDPEIKESKTHPTKRRI